MENVLAHEEWKICFAQLGPALLLFARQWTSSCADAEDIVQDTFVRFWKHEHSVQNKALLYAAVRSTALDRLRRDQRRARREAEACRDVEEFSSPHFQAANDEQKLLAAAVDRLPAEQREVVV